MWFDVKLRTGAVTRAADFFTGKPLAVEAGAVRLDLPGYSWRAFVLR